MKKSLIALAVAAAVVAPSANAVTTLYGKVRQAVSQVEGDAFSGTSGGNSATLIHDNSSRLGVKGSEDLGNGLSAIYQMEFGVGINGGHKAASGSTGFSNRNQFVGLKGGFGTFLIGRHDTPAKMALGKVAYMFGGAHEADDAIGIGFESGVRADNVLAYVSPNMSGFTFAVATVAGEAEDATGNADGIGEGMSAAVMYSNGPFYAGLGYTKFSQELLAAGDDKEVTGLALKYSPGPWEVGYKYENSDTGTGGREIDTHLLVGGYKFGNNKVLVKYGIGENTADGASFSNDFDVWGLWLEHNFSKRSKVYFAHSEKSYDATGTNDSSITSLGLEHSF